MCHEDQKYYVLCSRWWLSVHLRRRC